MAGSSDLFAVARPLDRSERLLPTSALACSCDQSNEPRVSTEPRRTLLKDSADVSGVLLVLCHRRSCGAWHRLVDPICLIVGGRAASHRNQRGIGGGQSVA